MAERNLLEETRTKLTMLITDTITTLGRIAEDSLFGKVAKGFKKALSLSNIGERLGFY